MLVGPDSVVVGISSIMTRTGADKALVELTSVADAVWTWAAHEATLKERRERSQGDVWQCTVGIVSFKNKFLSVRVSDFFILAGDVKRCICFDPNSILFWPMKLKCHILGMDKLRFV